MIQWPIDLVTGQSEGWQAVRAPSPRSSAWAVTLLAVGRVVLARATRKLVVEVADTALRVAEPTVAGAYRALVRSRVAAEASYRASFAIDVAHPMFLVVVEFVDIYVIFHQVDSLGGFSYAEVALMYGLASAAFGPRRPAPSVTSTGCRSTYAPAKFDAFLLRPLSALGELLTSDFSPAPGRPGGSIGLVILTAALTIVDIDWTPARVALLVVTPGRERSCSAWSS